MKKIFVLSSSIIAIVLLTISVAIYANDAVDKMLLIALQNDNLREAAYWLEHGANANCVDENGQPVLVLAMNKDYERHHSFEKFDNSVALTELLLQYGADPNSNTSLLPLVSAVLKEGDYRLCNVLLKYGANPRTVELYEKIDMNAVNYAKHLGYTRVAKLLTNPKTYSEEYTVVELNYLIKITFNNQQYDETVKYCEQFYRQLPNELSSNYSGWLSNAHIYFFHESALFQKSLLASQANDFDETEKLLLEAIRYEEERKRLGDTVDLGVNLNEELVRVRTWELEVKNFSNASIISDAQFVIQQGRKDSTAIWVLLSAADYALQRSDFQSKDYYLRTAYQYVKTDVNLRKQLNPQLYWQLLNEVTSHFYLSAFTTPIISESEVDEASAYIVETYGENSLQSMQYTMSKVLYYCYQNKIDKAILINKTFIGTLDNLLKKERNTSDEVKALYAFAHLTLSGLYEEKYNSDSRKKYRSVFDTEPMQQSPEDFYAYNTLKKILDNPQFNKNLHIEFYTSFIKLCYDLEHIEEIWQYVPIYYQLNHTRIDNALSTLSEEDAMYWWGEQPFHYDNTILLATKYHTIPDNIAGEIYNNELFKKDILLRTNQRIQQYIANNGDTTAIHLYQQLIEQKEQLLKWQSSRHYKDKQMQELVESINSTERLFASISNAYVEIWQESKITWKEIQSRLKPNEVAIEFLNTGYIDQYWALLIRKEYNYPKLVYLPNFRRCYPEEIKSAMDMWHQYGEDFGMEPPEFLLFEGDAGEIYKYGENGTKLYDALWEPLTKYIQEHETVYFAPSGVLLQLSVEALPIDEKNILIDKYNLIRVSSTRELVRQKDSHANRHAVLYGNIQYDVRNTESLVEQSKKYRGLNRGSNANRIDGVNRGSFEPLPGTAKEVQTITKQLNEARYETRLLETLTANEESVKALSGKSPQILHIATHAFYWDNERACNEPFVTHSTPQGEVTMINPMSRCGILLAGGNLAYSGKQDQLPDGIEDGILTAEEISILDLRQTKLLVLSACETGLGELTDAGVFGLQRAFKKAGVETIIMSLWKADDEATQILMTEFYKNWITLRQSKREAFHNAQNIIRSKPKYKNPHYWAGFIMLD